MVRVGAWQKKESSKWRNSTEQIINGGRCKWWIICIRNLYQPLEGKAKKPSRMSNEEWALLDIKVLGTIWVCLATSMAFNILEEKITKDLMDTLKGCMKIPLPIKFS